MGSNPFVPLHTSSIKFPCHTEQSNHFNMPGSIRVSVLEAFDLPETTADGKDVSVKVSVGKREYQTTPSRAAAGKTTSWNSDFVFPVLNLQDSLVVVLLGDDGEAISKNEIDTPSIVERGLFDVDLPLNGGGNIHLRLSFVLTDEERRRIDAMRAAALKRREQESSKVTANFQSVPMGGESEMSPSVPLTTTTGSLQEDPSKADVAKDPAVTTSQELDFSHQNASGAVLPETGKESALVDDGLEGKPEKVTSLNLDLPEKALHRSMERTPEMLTSSPGNNGKNVESTSLDSGSQPITEITVTGAVDSTAPDIESQLLADGMATKISDSNSLPTTEETVVEALKSTDLENKCALAVPDQTITGEVSLASECVLAIPDQTVTEDSRGLRIEFPETSDSKLTPNSVKAKIKAFEKSMPQGAGYLSQTLPSLSIKLQKLSSGEHAKIAASKRVEEEAEPLEKEKEHLHDVATRRIEDERLDPVRHMESVALKRLLEGEETLAAAQKPLVSSVPAQGLNNFGALAGDLVYKSSVLEQPKSEEYTNLLVQNNKNTNLLGISKQVLSGAIVLAAGVLLWAANSNRRNLSVHQKSKQRKRK